MYGGNAAAAFRNGFDFSGQRPLSPGPAMAKMTVPLVKSIGGVLRGDDAESHDQVTAARHPGLPVDKLQLQCAPGAMAREGRTRDRLWR